MYYTNMADSIMASKFAAQKSNKQGIKKFFRILNKMEKSEKIERDYQIVITLNQIADNPAIITDDSVTNEICSLLNKNKILISTYDGFDIVSYILNRLASALKRIYQTDENQKDDSELRFICSLFPTLGKGAYTRLKNEKMKLILGNIYDYRKRDFFQKVNEAIEFDNFYESLLDIAVEYDKNECNHEYGYFTTLYKIFFLTMKDDERLELIKNIPLVFDGKEEERFRRIMNNVYLLDKATKRKYKPNSTFLKKYKVFDIPEKATLCKVIRGFINNNELFNEKFEFWFQGVPEIFIEHKEIIREFLEKTMFNFSTLASGRSSMYDQIEKELDAYLLSPENNEELKVFFQKSSYTNRNDREHNKTTRSMMVDLIKIAIDFCYNIHNTLLSNTEKRMLEAEYIIYFEDGYMNITNITNATYNLDSYGKLLRTSREKIEYVL